MPLQVRQVTSHGKQLVRLTVILELLQMPQDRFWKRYKPLMQLEHVCPLTQVAQEGMQLLQRGLARSVMFLKKPASKQLPQELLG